jgi:hypothetical protein
MLPHLPLEFLVCLVLQQFPIDRITTLGYLMSPLRRPTVIGRWICILNLLLYIFFCLDHTWKQENLFLCIYLPGTKDGPLRWMFFLHNRLVTINRISTGLIDVIIYRISLCCREMEPFRGVGVWGEPHDIRQELQPSAETCTYATHISFHVSKRRWRDFVYCIYYDGEFL